MGWGWCSAAARSACTAARSGWRTEPGGAAASACGCRSRGCRCRRCRPRRRWGPRAVALRSSRRSRLTDETPATRRLLAEYRQEVWDRTDRLFLWLLLGQAVVAIGAALLAAPKPWNGPLGLPVLAWK